MGIEGKSSGEPARILPGMLLAAFSEQRELALQLTR